MRARWLKPEFFTDKKIAQLDPTTALVYQALWCWADDGGTVQADPDLLKAHIFYRWSAVTVRTITGALQTLSALGRIELYRVGDDLYANIRNWKKHQSVHKPSKFRHPQISQGVRVDGASLLPECPGTSVEIPTARVLDSYNPRVLDSRAEPREESDSSAADSPDELFPQSEQQTPSPEPTPTRHTDHTPEGAKFVLGPYLDAHFERFPGSVPPAGRYGKAFKRLEAKHGHAETLRRWKICLARDGTFASPEKLAAHWSEYESEPVKVDPFAHLAGYPELVIDGELTEYGERVTRPDRPVRIVA